MALSPQLLQFKSSGVYRLEFDKSQTSNIDVETLRLVVGTSRKGPYNTPVLIETVEAFINVFGDIDRNLEKKRMFFHRSAIEALSRGPILALNLGKMETGVDTANYQALSTTGSVADSESKSGSADYSEFFNTDKFWTPSDENTLNEINAGENNLLNFVNIKQDSITVVARQAADVSEFNMTAREWYGEGNVPSHLNQYDRMSDYMLDVFVFKGEFDPVALANDPIYGDYFDADGLLVEKLAQFANLRQVTLLAQYTGSILPGFKDLEGRNLYIESLINAEARRTGLFCAVDEEAVLDEQGTKADFVGHKIDADQDFELLSHVVKQGATKEHTINLAGASVTLAGNIIELTNVLETEYNNALIDTEDFLESLTPGEYVKIDAITNYAVNTQAVAAVPDQYNQGTATTATPSNIDSVTAGTGNTLIITPTTGNALDLDTLVVGRWVTGGSGNLNVEVTNITNQTNPLNPLAADDVAVIAFGGAPDSSVANAIATGSINHFGDNGFVAGTPAVLQTVDFHIECEDSVAATYAAATKIELWHVENTRVFNYDFAEDSGVYAANPGSDNFTVDYTQPNAPTSFELSVGMYVDSITPDRIARIEKIAKVVDELTGDVQYTVYCNIEPDYANRYIKSFANSSPYYKTFVLPKAQIGVKKISEYLNTLSGGNGLYDALIDKDIIDFRYIVDTFGSFDGNLLNKRQLSLLAKDRENASAILNAPTIAEFKLSTDPSFIGNSGFSTSFIETGGNLDKNPTSLYTLPSIAEGANYAFYYGPGLIVADNGKDIIVPPAAYVANNYIDKYTNALPWSIVAGPRRGVVSGANVKGAEYSFDKNDRDILEPFGINPIVFQRGVGLTILGNKTAQQSIKSALSSAHVREVLIYIQDGMADILKDYVFEFNTVQTRLEIKTLADSFMESVKQDGGVYEFRNVMDQTNNTNEVIDNNMGIIDTYVEPVKGLEIVVHRTTILNTGEIQSGNLG
jgi:hypothetical protein